MSEVDIVEISASVVPCVDGFSRHTVDRRARSCTRCKKSIGQLRCPTHEKVYSHNVELAPLGGFLRKWICRICLSEGEEPFPEAQEYQILRGRKLAVIPAGGALEDSPQVDLRTEYPSSFAKREPGAFDSLSGEQFR